MTDQAATEEPARLYWLDGEGNGMEVRPDGAIRLHHGGYVVTKTLGAWLELAWPLDRRGIRSVPAAPEAQPEREVGSTKEGQGSASPPLEPAFEHPHTKTKCPESRLMCGYWISHYAHEAKVAAAERDRLITRVRNQREEINRLASSTGAAEVGVALTDERIMKLADEFWASGDDEHDAFFDELGFARAIERALGAAP